MKHQISPMDLEHRTADRELVSTFDITNYHIDALLFQTGYLTIAGKEQSAGLLNPNTGWTIRIMRSNSV